MAQSLEELRKKWAPVAQAAKAAHADDGATKVDAKVLSAHERLDQFKVCHDCGGNGLVTLSYNHTVNTKTCTTCLGPLHRLTIRQAQSLPVQHTRPARRLSAWHDCAMF